MVKSFLILFLIISSCSNNQEVKSNFKESRDIKMKIELDIYPFGGGEIGYTVLVEDESLITKIRELDIQGDDIILGKTIKQSSKRLGGSQFVSLNKNAELISERTISNNFALDTWVYSLSLNGELMIKFDSSNSQKQSHEVKEVIKYLLKESPLKIDLHHFS